MNLAYKKILGKFTKVLGFGKTPPHVGKDSQIISFFSFDSVPNCLIAFVFFAVSDFILTLSVFVSVFVPVFVSVIAP